MARKAKNEPEVEAAMAENVERHDSAEETSGGKNIFDRNRYNYEKNGVKTSTGRPSVDNGDAVAVAIRGKSAEEVIALVRDNGEEVPARWSELNRGMQRMNAANVLRRLAKADGVQIDGNTIKIEKVEA